MELRKSPSRTTLPFGCLRSVNGLSVGTWPCKALRLVDFRRPLRGALRCCAKKQVGCIQAGLRAVGRFIWQAPAGFTCTRDARGGESNLVASGDGDATQWLGGWVCQDQLKCAKAERLKTSKEPLNPCGQSPRQVFGHSCRPRRDSAAPVRGLAVPRHLPPRTSSSIAP